MRARAVLLVLLTLAAVACTRTVDLTTACKVTPIATGWYDAGITEDGKNKLVPSISLSLTNTGAAPWGGVQINCIFRRVGDPEEWSTVLVRGLAAGANDLQPGATTKPIVIRAPQGYTGTQPRADILSNHLFVDAKVEVFGKAGSANWVKLGEYPITRQLLSK
jgi:hypothetical protein